MSFDPQSGDTQKLPPPGPAGPAPEPVDEPPDRRPIWVALAIGVLAVVVAVAIQPSVVTGGATSLQAVVFAVVLGAVFVGFVALVVRFVRQPYLAAALVGLPLLVVAGGLAFTALVDDEADDEQAEQLAADLADAESTTETTAAADASTDTSPTTDTTAPAGPVRLSTGTFEGLDNHSGSGTVSLVEQPDGSQVVLFEDFEVENGPDYFVYLVAGEANYEASAGVEVAALQGNVGDQQYAVPGELVGTQPLTVLIWCRAFDTNIAGATV